MELTATKMAPPLRLVAKYFFASVCFFILLCGLFVLSWQHVQGFYFQPRLLALTHLATLGWITMTIFGALFQLIPVVLEVPLWSARLGEWQFWIYLAGVLGLTSGFWFHAFGAYLEVAAVLLLFAGYLFLWNIIRTMQSVKKWNLTGGFLIAGLFYFFFTISLGATLVFNFGRPFLLRSHLDYLNIHAHLGLVGWALMIIMGVSLKLVPMFSISHDFSLRYATGAFILINLGLLGFIVDDFIFGNVSWLPIFFALLGLGILFYIIQIVVVLRHRLRKALDVPMRHTILFLVALLLVVLLGVAIPRLPFGVEMAERITLLYGFLALFGVISSIIIGQMYKIVPFLVWLERYAPLAGVEAVPTMKDLVNVRIARVELWFLGTSLAIVGVGILTAVQPLVAIGGLILFAASVLFGYNIFYVFRK